MRFLAMANGIQSEKQTLKDFFRSDGVDGGHLAAGLDQWFIRCVDNEFRDSSHVGVSRGFKPATAGIQRCYKNANYLEGRTTDGILRGNYCLDGASAQDPAGFGGLARPIYASPLFYVNHQPVWYEWPEWEAEQILVDMNLDLQIMETQASWTGRQRDRYSLFKRFRPSPDPSCVNYRSRFLDQCANVNDTIGLVAEYEWAAAYWFCFHVSWRGFCSFLNPMLKFHIPFPAAIFGGRAGDHYGSSPDPASIAQAQEKMFTPKRQVDGITVSGWSRDEYHRTFIGGDAEPRYDDTLTGLLSDGMNGANMGAKGYVRIYGDDKNIIDDCYVGARAMPWVLNEKFFNGAGTILVGIARRQRNVFERIFGTDGIYAAFTPVGEHAAPHLVALSAARAAYAPRTGDGKGDGPDSVNNHEYPKAGSGWSGRRYELRYDSVTDGVDGKFAPKFGAKTSDQGTIEKTLRVGCVCGGAETPEERKVQGDLSQRLRRQWNLCQTDWDAVLLPVRHAMANPSLTSSSARYDSLTDADPTFWSFAENYAEKDPQYSLFFETFPRLDWFSFTGGGGISFKEIAFRPHGLDEQKAFSLYKRRMIH